MTFTVHDVPQRSAEWFAIRAGKLTASRASDMLSTIKTGEAAPRRNYRAQLVLERLTGKPQENGYVSKAMQDGIDREPDAAALYEALTGRLITPTGFLAHLTLPAGCSLDGHVGEFEGLVEIKCPIPATHLDFLKSGIVPGDYVKQATHQLWITGAQWCDYVSYHPDFPEPLQAKVARIQRNEAEITSYELLARQFLSEVDRELDELAKIAGVVAA